MSRQRQTVTILLVLASAGLKPFGHLVDLDLESHGVGASRTSADFEGLAPCFSCTHIWRRGVCLATFPQPKSLGAHCERLAHGWTQAKEGFRTKTGCE